MSQTLNQSLSEIAFYDKQTGWRHVVLPEAINISAEFSHQRLAEDCQAQMIQADNELSFCIGIDEVGRGPLYGSVVVAGAILPQRWSKEIELAALADTPLSMLTDSKKLTEKKRESLFPLIKQYAIGYVTTEIPAAVIDMLNIFQATMTAMRLSAEVLVKALSDGLAKGIAEQKGRCSILIDGNKLPQFAWSQLQDTGIASNLHITSEAWIKGDARHSSMAAASVLAKVTRDRQVVADASNYPEYQLDKHKGYPTKAHLAAIAEYGILPQHRRSFAPIKAIVQESQSSSDKQNKLKLS